MENPLVHGWHLRLAGLPGRAFERSVNPMSREGNNSWKRRSLKSFLSFKGIILNEKKRKPTVATLAESYYVLVNWFQITVVGLIWIWNWWSSFLVQNTDYCHTVSTFYGRHDNAVVLNNSSRSGLRQHHSISFFATFQLRTVYLAFIRSTEWAVQTAEDSTSTSSFRLV